MSGPPKTELDASIWIRSCLEFGAYYDVKHFRDEMLVDGIEMADVHHAIVCATSVIPYTKKPPEHGGTCWRLFGPNLDDERQIAIGFEAFIDASGKRVVLVTAFRMGRYKKGKNEKDT